MTNEVKKDMRGVFFPNLNKNKPTQPDLSGKAMIKGVSYRMAIWENKTADNKTYYSVIFSDDDDSDNKNPQNNKSSNSSSNYKPSNQSNSSSKKDDSGGFDDLDDILNITDNPDK